MGLDVKIDALMCQSYVYNLTVFILVLNFHVLVIRLLDPFLVHSIEFSLFD